MTTNDVTRLYHLLDALRHESKQQAQEIRDEVQGYRADLNGRLKALELAEARREGMGVARGSIGRIIWGVAAVSAAIGSIVGVIATLV
jgi:ElaB/YqjD/DUF883 family membrane-anchored ribosome-binding protein